jgi:hypothetical protein
MFEENCFKNIARALEKIKLATETPLLEPTDVALFNTESAMRHFGSRKLYPTAGGPPPNSSVRHDHRL